MFALSILTVLFLYLFFDLFEIHHMLDVAYGYSFLSALHMAVQLSHNIHWIVYFYPLILDAVFIKY